MKKRKNNNEAYIDGSKSKINKLGFGAAFPVIPRKKVLINYRYLYTQLKSIE